MTLPDRASEQSWSSAVLLAHLGFPKQAVQKRTAVLPLPPPRRLTSPPALHSVSKRGRQAPPGGLGSRAASLSWGCGRELRHAEDRPNPPAHVPAVEECTRETLSGRHSEGSADPASGAGTASPTQVPGCLVLSVLRCVPAAKHQLEKTQSCPSHPSDRALTAGVLGSVKPTGP